MLDTKAKFKDKYFETGIVWQINHTTLPINRDLAERRLYLLGGKLEKNQVLEWKYTKTMNQDIVNGYPGKMMEPKPHNTSTTTSFIPISILIRFRTSKYAVIAVTLTKTLYDFYG